MAEHPGDPVAKAADHHDPVGHHAGAAAAATGMKKKIGPLPLYVWVAIIGGTIGIFLLYRSKSASGAGSSTTAAASQTGSTVDPSNPLGLTYDQEQADIAEGIDPNTGETYASEQASADTSADSGSGSGGGGDAGSTDDTGDGTSTDSTGDTDSGGADDGDTPTPHHHGDNSSDSGGDTSPVVNITLTPTPATAKTVKAKAAPRVNAAGLVAVGSAGSSSAAANVGHVAVAAPKKVKVAGGALTGKGAQDVKAKAPAKVTPAKKVTVSGKKK